MKVLTWTIPVVIGLAVDVSSSVLAQPQMTPDAAARQWLFYVDGGDYV
jgi:hypothetical protein